ncbi:ATP-binding protein [uncultured Massilia sp.]|uniref:ATP-binding protein n=1 Tax=uncultured Massilia sp. TaxID=169973 RepID=UPI0025D7219B|nr:ATP-binding protein [uncultured Massilia sp.]
MEATRPARPSSLFRRLVLGFSGVIVIVFLLGLAYVLQDARITQRTRTAAENEAHAREALLHLALLADRPAALVAAAQELERVRAHMFATLDYHSQVRLRVWRHGRLLYDSRPGLADALPTPDQVRLLRENGWVTSVARDAASGLVVARSHEVDDLWMLSMSGISFLASSTVFSLPLLLLPAWLIVGIGLRPLRSIADAIEQRAVSDLTALPASPYRELSPLVDAINRLMKRLSERIEREHQFLTDAAHELKTPLVAVQINAHVLLSRCDPETRARCADAEAGLRDGVERATRMVHQLLALERTQAEPPTTLPPPLDLGALVRDRLAAAVPLALQRAIEIEFQADAECLLPLHVESVGALVDNLVSNAIKYSPEGGTIEVALQPCAGGCRLSVADQGPGIAPALQKKVFERFYRIPGQDQPGSGLGLAIAERAAERNGGAIRLENQGDGGGLRVVVDFAAA